MNEHQFRANPGRPAPFSATFFRCLDCDGFEDDAPHDAYHQTEWAEYDADGRSLIYPGPGGVPYREGYPASWLDVGRMAEEHDPTGRACALAGRAAAGHPVAAFDICRPCYEEAVLTR